MPRGREKGSGVSARSTLRAVPARDSHPFPTEATGVVSLVHFGKTTYMNGQRDDTWTTDRLQQGDLAAVKQRWLQDPAYVTSRDYVGNTPLLTAIGFGELALVEWMLEHGADPNVDVDDGYTCLLTAIESEEPASLEIISRLLNAGVDIHAMGMNGWTALHMAAARGSVDKARLLIAAGADVNRRKEIDGSETPLMEAAFCGHPEMVRLLLQCGADPTMRDTTHDHTPLEIAQHAARGADPTVYEYLKTVDFQLDLDDTFADLDLPPEQLEMLKSQVKHLDMAESYRENADRLARR